MKVTTLVIDLAKDVFQLRGVNEYGKTVIKKQIRRDQTVELMQKRRKTPCFSTKSAT